MWTRITRGQRQPAPRLCARSRTPTTARASTQRVISKGTCGASAPTGLKWPRPAPRPVERPSRTLAQANGPPADSDAGIDPRYKTDLDLSPGVNYHTTAFPAGAIRGQL